MDGSVLLWEVMIGKFPTPHMYGLDIWRSNVDRDTGISFKFGLTERRFADEQWQGLSFNINLMLLILQPLTSLINTFAFSYYKL